MDTEKADWEQKEYDDEIPDPEEEPAPRDDEAEAVIEAARKHRVPADENVPNDCFSDKLL